MAPRKNHRTPQTIIIGGGFAGTEIARKLADEGVSNVTLISNKTYFEYYPAFYRVVTGIAPIEVCIPLSEMVPKEVDLIFEHIKSVDLEKKEVTSSKGHVYKADYIIMALGSQTSYFNIKGLVEHSFGFKSIGEATELKNHIKNLFINKKTATDDMVSTFQVVIVGGGPSGVEVAGDLTEYMKHLAKKHDVEPSFITIDIIERGNRLIGATHEHASNAALGRLRELGVNVFLNREVMAEDVENILMGDMSLKTKTVIWTAGTTVNELYSTTKGLEFTERRRVKVNEYLEADGFENIYIAGDGAGTKNSGLAQTAIYDGNFIAKDIVKKIKNKDRKKYIPKEVDYIIPIGKNWAIMSFGKFHIFGRLAYFARHMVDFLYFAKNLSPQKTFNLFLKGRKYR